MHFDMVLATIADMKAALQQDISAVSVGLGLLRAEHHKLAARVKDVESGSEEVLPAHINFARQVATLTRRVCLLEYRAEGAKGCSQRNNVCIVGLPEGTEGSHILSYLEQWMKPEVATNNLMPFFVLERGSLGLAGQLQNGISLVSLSARDK
ncbi:hypothetical protein NDU88_004513 [Pleurodeles waltl]|uniref:Uncharacterized protein n=1 Tax=Pleurodeles waltl TaxID=8319 RepID=A0AAV7PEB1_PLEWA|nr:hypothetical protein NDU88_004513 [Pleurodeles waltl]